MGGLVAVIRVTVELDSAVSSARDRVLGRAEVWNDGVLSEEDPSVGRYVGTFETLAPGGEVATRRTASVPRFRRATNDRDAWDLLFLLLFAALGEERVLALAREAMEPGRDDGARTFDS